MFERETRTTVIDYAWAKLVRLHDLEAALPTVTGVSEKHPLTLALIVKPEEVGRHVLPTLSVDLKTSP